MFWRAVLFVAVYAAWLVAVASVAALSITGHHLASFVTAVAVALGAVAVTGLLEERARRSVTGEPLSRWHWAVAGLLSAVAFVAAMLAGGVYSGIVGRGVPAVVLRTGCAEVAENGGGCGPTCEFGRVEDGRSLGWMTCVGTSGRAGDLATVRIDPAGHGRPTLAEESFRPLPARVLAGAALAGAGLAGLLLFDAICRPPARAARARAAPATDRG